MDKDQIIRQLEAEWDIDRGFFGLLREGIYDHSRYQTVIGLLNAISFEGETCIDKRLVGLLWFLPTFLEWQRDRVEDRSQAGEEVDKAITTVIDILMRILGLP